MVLFLRIACVLAVAIALGACTSIGQSSPVPGIATARTPSRATSAALPLSATLPSHIYVTNRTNNTVTAYDELGNQIALPAGFAQLAGPTAIAYDGHDGLLYVTNKNNTVTAYDQNGNLAKLPGTFPEIHGPTGIAYDSQNHVLYVANTGVNMGKVTEYDEQGNQLRANAGGFPNVYGPSGIMYDEHSGTNGLLYVTNEKNNTVTAYDALGRPQSIPTEMRDLDGPAAIVYNTHNALIYIDNFGNNTVTAYDTLGNEFFLSGGFPQLDGPVAIAFDPRNDTLYVVNSGSSTVGAYRDKGSWRNLPPGSFRNLSGPSGLAIVPQR
ncbi:MAG: hypothetical protein ABI282_01590 [Candidatus Baltobacteraceae bacterium]